MFFIAEDDNFLMHEGRSKKDGAPVGSGRYPLGSGEIPYQHQSGFRSMVADMKKSGMSESEIAKYFGFVDRYGNPSTTKLRAAITINKEEQMAENVAQVLKYKEHGYSNSEIARKMNTTEGNVRNWLKKSEEIDEKSTKATADILKDEVAEKKYLDVGLGTGSQLGIPDTKLKAAITRLELEGYQVMSYWQQQAGTGEKTKMNVLVAPDVEYSELLKNRDQIRPVGEWYSEDLGNTWLGIKPPVSIDPKRVMVRYDEEGGSDKDGVIELRRGVEDISLGDARYAQVRIAVDGTHYLKGMAMYSDDMPKGVDIIFNTNKSSKVPMIGPDKDNTVLKPIKDDPDNPFGATIRQRNYIGKDGKEHLSAINIVNEEGDWDNWSKKLSSQFLSKQSDDLARRQLKLAYDVKKDEFDTIMAYTNPTVKKKLLESFADDCDSAAVHLKAAALPRQANKVLLPLSDVKDNEIYAPTFKQGEKVVLIRHPHGGIFEIPELTVNNKIPSGKKLLGLATDAVGISAATARKLSGADFDGDTALVIPNNSGKVRVSDSLKQLKDFDPQKNYPAYPGMKRVGDGDGFHKQQEMGKISNLITDMTIKGADQAEIARAVKHSMVVIDAEKHNLDWKTSYKDNNISELKKKYQGKENAGAATVISRAKSQERPLDREEIFATSKMTPAEKKAWEAGEKVYRETGKVSYQTGKPKMLLSTKMAETNDPYTLTSGGSKKNPGTTMEGIYAEYATQMKDLAKQARKEIRTSKSQEYSPTAAKTYAQEVGTLNAKLNVALKNKPLERAAQVIAGSIVRSKKKDNPDMDREEEKKVQNQAIAEARRRMGTTSKKDRDIAITPKEWEAIQAGAISHNKLSQILSNTDLDVVKQYATPRTTRGMSTAKISRAKAMLSNGYTQSEVAEALGVSVSTLTNNVDVKQY